MFENRIRFFLAPTLMKAKQYGGTASTTEQEKICVFKSVWEIKNQTRMHSSRMHTARGVGCVCTWSRGVCTWSLGGVYLVPGGWTWSWTGGGICPGTPPCEQNSWHTLLKILPCPKLRLRVVKMQHSTFLCSTQIKSSVLRLTFCSEIQFVMGILAFCCVVYFKLDIRFQNSLNLKS